MLKYCLWLSILLAACTKTQVEEPMGKIQFRGSVASLNHRQADMATIDHIHIEITSMDDAQSLQFGPLPIQLADGRVSFAPIELPVGTYQLTKLEVRNAQAEPLYYTPGQESELCRQFMAIDACLPLDFSIAPLVTNTINLTTISVAAPKAPQETGIGMEVTLIELIPFNLVALRYICPLNGWEYFQQAPQITDSQGREIPFARINENHAQYHSLLVESAEKYHIDFQTEKAKKSQVLSLTELKALDGSPVTFQFDTIACNNEEPPTPPAENPEFGLTISEALSAPLETEADLHGYIVGTTSSGPNFKLTAPFTSSTNIALADMPNETVATKILPLQLPSGAIREVLNLKDNPDLLGKKIVVRGGTLQSYFGTTGLKSPKEYEILP